MEWWTKIIGGWGQGGKIKDRALPVDMLKEIFGTDDTNVMVIWVNPLSIELPPYQSYVIGDAPPDETSVKFIEYRAFEELLARKDAQVGRAMKELKECQIERDQLRNQLVNLRIKNDLP